MRWWPLILAGLQVSCQTSAFTCTSDESCGGGQCELNGYCSFPDEDCESGQRFGEFAGGGVAGQCVGEELVDTDATSTGTGPSPSPSSTATLTSPMTSPATGAGTDSTTTPTTAEASSSHVSTSSISESSTTAPLQCPEDEWWDCGFTLRSRLGFAAAGVEAPLVDFIVLVELDGQILPGLPSDLNDVRFVDDDGVTELPFELEWSGDGERWFAWVRVPQLDASSGEDFIWLYYGGQPGLPPYDPDAVWGSEHVGVFHLGEEVGDSSPNGVDVQDLGTQLEAGAVGQGRYFDGNVGIELLSGVPLHQMFVDGGAISAWFRADGWGTGAHGRIVGHSTNTSTLDGYAFYVGGGQMEPQTLGFAHAFDISASESVAPPGSLELDMWHHVTVVYSAVERSRAALYIDGSEVLVDIPREGSGEADFGNGVPVMLGNTPGDFDRGFEGVLDEIRFSTRPKSPSRIRLEYLSESGGLVEPGAVESWAQ